MFLHVTLLLLAGHRGESSCIVTAKESTSAGQTEIKGLAERFLLLRLGLHSVQRIHRPTGTALPWHGWGVAVSCSFESFHDGWNAQT